MLELGLSKQVQILFNIILNRVLSSNGVYETTCQCYARAVISLADVLIEWNPLSTPFYICLLHASYLILSLSFGLTISFFVQLTCNSSLFTRSLPTRNHLNGKLGLEKVEFLNVSHFIKKR